MYFLSTMLYSCFLDDSVDVGDTKFVCVPWYNSDAPLDLKIKSNMVSDLFSLIGTSQLVHILISHVIEQKQLYRCLAAFFLLLLLLLEIMILLSLMAYNMTTVPHGLRSI